MEKETSDFISNFVKALKENSAVVFAGAGLSVDSGFFEWKGLLEPIAERLGLDIREEPHSAALAQYLVEEEGGRGDFNQLLVGQYQLVNVILSIHHRILARLPIQIFWTANESFIVAIRITEVIHKTTMVHWKSVKNRLNWILIRTCANSMKIPEVTIRIMRYCVRLRKDLTSFVYS